MKTNKRNWSVAIIYFAVIILTLIVRVSFSCGVFQDAKIDSGYIFTILVQIIIFGIIPFACYMLSHKYFSNEELSAFESFAWRFGFTKKVGIKNWIRTILIAFLMLFTATLVSVVWQIMLNLFGYKHQSQSTNYDSVGKLILELFMVAILPGVFEEFTHRGLLFAGFRTDRKKDKIKMVLLSALMFSLMHQNIRQTGYTFYDGIILALICYYTGSILLSMLVHIINNGTSVLTEYSEQHGLGLVNKMYDWLLSDGLHMLVYLVLFGLAMILLVFLLYRMKKEKNKADLKAEMETKEKHPDSNEAVVVFDNKDKMGFWEKQKALNKGSNFDKFTSYFPCSQTYRKNVVLWVTVALGIVCTVFTLVWGILI